PYIGAGPTVGNYVTVAWNARREAVRAVNDALPMLERADQVDVLSVNPRVGPEDHGEIPSADICLHLARHGVSATAQSVVANDIDVANLLMSRCADTGSDMIVMGAYGHSRLRESVLGGTTHDVLRSMTVPVLMSH
ncbi:MAG: universal stress protein, partial [Gammaproteobacteria bacterium]|nr:universal stress protein [Gammaproteobacteria bacterium]